MHGWRRLVLLGVLLSGLAAANEPSALFSSYDQLTLQLEAPFSDLFNQARADDSHAVPATLSYSDEAGRAVTIEDVTIALRGHTSRRETECVFPKLKLQLASKPRHSVFAGLSSIKIGTHCGDAEAEALTPRYGRLANELSPLREAFVYRLLDALNVPALRARPARITYVDTGDAASPRREPLTRNAMLLEDDDTVRTRVGAHEEIEPEAFTAAFETFSPQDLAMLAFAQASIGNFDWCLKFTADDTYRCNAQKKLWNIMALRGSGRTLPLMYDFDVSGMVAGKHQWFDRIFNRAFVRSRSEVEIEVVSQLQRTRTLFARDLIDATRRRFLDRKRNAYQALDEAPLDGHGRDRIREYLDQFFAAIGSDDVFYRPVVTAANTMAYTAPDRTAVACQSRGPIPVGTPVSEPQEVRGPMIRVVLLDALWRWAPPVQCPEITRGAVWIESAAVGRDFPSRPR